MTQQGAERVKASWSTVVACLCALAYVVMKVWMAADGEAGLPGFPATAEVNASSSHIALRQLGNGALGMAAIVLALATARPWGSKLVRWMLVAIAWGVLVALLAGTAVLLARLFTLTSAFAPLKFGMANILVTTVAIIWLLAWALLAWRMLRTQFADWRSAGRDS